MNEDAEEKTKPGIIRRWFGGGSAAPAEVEAPPAPEPLKILFDGALHVTEEDWRTLTWRWAFFFIALAALNEIVWRTQATDVWVEFRPSDSCP